MDEWILYMNGHGMFDPGTVGADFVPERNGLIVSEVLRMSFGVICRWNGNRLFIPYTSIKYMVERNPRE